MIYMIYGSKYETILKILLVFLVGCSLDLIFLIRDRPFGFLVGRGTFFQQFKTRFSTKKTKQKSNIFFDHATLCSELANFSIHNLLHH